MAEVVSGAPLLLGLQLANQNNNNAARKGIGQPVPSTTIVNLFVAELVDPSGEGTGFQN